MTAVTDRDGIPELFQLDRATCLALLGTHCFGRLVVTGEAPRVIPVNYTVLDGSIVFRCDRDGPAAALAGGDAVFEVDMVDQRTRSGWSVIVRGPTALVPPDQLERVVDRVDSWAPGLKDVYLIVAADEVSGRLLRGAIPVSVVDDHGYL